MAKRTNPQASPAKRTDAEIDAHVDGWYAKHGGTPEPEPVLADFLEFEFEKRLLILHLSNGRRLVLPLEDVQGLGRATREELEDYDLQEGQGIEWPALGVAHRVEGLLQGLYGNTTWMRKLQQNGTARLGRRPAASRKKVVAA